VHRLADREEATILLTTHDLDEAEKLADRILILAGGRIVADGSADELSQLMSTQAEVRWSRDEPPCPARTSRSHRHAGQHDRHDRRLQRAGHAGRHSDR